MNRVPGGLPEDLAEWGSDLYGELAADLGEVEIEQIAAAAAAPPPPDGAAPARVDR